MKNKNTYSGFVSNVYVFLNTVISLLFAALASVAVMAFASFGVALLVFPIVAAIIMLARYLYSPIPYKAVDLTSDGVRCGKKFVRYADIKSAYITSGRVDEKFGFSFLEDALGIPQHLEIYTEDIICINSEPKGLSGRDAKECIYLPKNKKTDAILRAKSQVYRAVAKRYDKEEKHPLNFMEGISKARVAYAAIASAVLIFIYVLLCGTGEIEIYECILLALFTLLLAAFAGFKDAVAVIFRNSKRQEKNK